MSVKRHLQIQFAGLFAVIASSTAVAQNNPESSYDRVRQLLEAFKENERLAEEFKDNAQRRAQASPQPAYDRDRQFVEEAKKFTRQRLRSDAEKAPVTAESPGFALLRYASGTSGGQISEAARPRYRYRRAAIRRDRARRFEQYRQELQGLGVSGQPSESEHFAESIASMSSSELRLIYESRLERFRNALNGTSEYLAALRELGLVSYDHAWVLLDINKREEARAVEGILDAVFGPYLEAPPPELVLPVARYFRLKSQFAWRQGNESEQARLIKQSGETIDRIDIYPPDFVLLARLKARSLLDDDTSPAGFRAEPCGIFDSLVALRPDSPAALRGFVDCQIAQANAQIKEGEALVAIATLDVAREYLMRVQSDHPNIAIQAGVLELEIINLLSKNEQNSPLTMSGDAYKFLAADRFVKIFKGRIYRQNSYWEISDIYSEFSDINTINLPPAQTSRQGRRDIAELFVSIADAVEASRAAEPGLPSLGLIAADSLARAAQIKLDRNDKPGADAASARAEQVMDQIGLITALDEVDERAHSECLVRNRRVKVLISLERTDDAIAAYRKFDQSCGVWVRTYPWEYYARWYATDINNRLGLYLNSKGLVADAIPMLTYASNWGVKDSSTALAGIYANPAGPLSDRAKADQLEALAERQSLKRFTVPSNFDGVKYPFHVYVAEYGEGPLCNRQAERLDIALEAKPHDPAVPCYGYKGIDDQAIWLKMLRGGDVPEDVAASFQKLYTISRDNNVSFPDLTVYALNEASKPEIAATDGQIETIYDEMKAKKFARSPDRWLDPAGIALGGHDAVSYREGSAPVLGSAEFYTLWDGALWLFKDAANRDLFSSDPDRFAPQYGGFSAWEVIDQDANAGEPAIFALVDDKLFMFDAEKHVADWKADAASKIAKADEAWLGMEPTGTAAATNLADRILKLGPVELADRAEFYVEGCQQNRGDQCVRLFRLARKQCIQNDSIPACNLAIAFAEGMEDKSALVSLLGSRSWKYAQANKPDEAITDAERALAIDPNQPWIHGNLANGLLMKGQVDRALAIYREQQDKPGPGQEGTMCKFILEDVDTMLAAKVLGEEAASEVRRAIVCP